MIDFKFTDNKLISLLLVYYNTIYQYAGGVINNNVGPRITRVRIALGINFKPRDILQILILAFLNWKKFLQEFKSMDLKMVHNKP